MTENTEEQLHTQNNDGADQPMMGQKSNSKAQFQSAEYLLSKTKNQDPYRTGESWWKDKVPVEDDENKDDLIEKQVYTGLSSASFLTQQTILEMFWMNMDFLVAFTLDDQSQIFIETFLFYDSDEVQPVCDKILLCELINQEQIQVKTDPTRQLVSFLMYNNQPYDLLGEPKHEIKGYTIDFRRFSPDSRQEDILVKEMDTTAMSRKLGPREINHLSMLYNNTSPYSYDMELLILVDCNNYKKEGSTFELFGAVKTESDENYEKIELYSKELKNPICAQKTQVIQFLRMSPSVSLIIFEDGLILHLQNYQNNGIIGKHHPTPAFSNFNQAIYEEETGLVCFQNLQRQRSFFQYSDDHWSHVTDQQKGVFRLMKIMGKFAIARHQDKFMYLLELNKNYDIVLSVRLGDEATWNYTFDADAKFPQFVVLFQKSGKGFVWKKYDKQDQFLLSKFKTLEQVCQGTLIRVVRDKCAIQVKEDLSQFEDPFYEFLNIEFSGLPIIVSSFTPYKMQDDESMFFLTIKPEQLLLKKKVKPQYFVVVDVNKAKALECKVKKSEKTQEPWIFKNVFFLTSTRFIGQRSTSPTIYEFCEYEIIKPTSPDEPWQIVRNDKNLLLTAKGITAVAYKQQQQSMIFMTEQVSGEVDEFVVYQLNLEQYLKNKNTKWVQLVDVEVTEVSEVVGRLDVFTEPISVFTREDKLLASGCYDHITQVLYALVSSPNLSLLYRVSLGVTNTKCRFQQIISIKSARQLFKANMKQLVALSNTQVCVFTLDSEEQRGLERLFQPGSEEKQCKLEIGRNIDLKMDFDSKLHCATSNLSIVALIFGSQSVLLQLDESMQTKQLDSNGAVEFTYDKSINTLNDLSFLFKQILLTKYHTRGYIRITEDQGNWDQSDSYMPVTLNSADFVTLIQDEEGNQGSDEMTLVRHLFLNNYNIWESIFRNALANHEMEITFEQMNRFLTPVITDHCNNLLFHFCYNHEEMLEKIVTMPGFEEYYKAEKKMFPIFYNFFGQSQITIALMAHDNKSFYKLLDVMITQQNCMESSYLVGSWLLNAFNEGLDINRLLDSQILSTVCDLDILEHFHKWPNSHKDREEITENYPKSFNILMHDEDAYDRLFGHMFQDIEREIEPLLKKNLYETEKDEMREQLYPIRYIAERLPVSASTPEEQSEIVFQLLEILSKTEQICYFKSGFIQRLIMYQWNGPLVKYYRVVSGCYCLSFVLIVSASILLRWHVEYPAEMQITRIFLLATNLLLLCCTLCTFEIKSFLSDKAGYLKSFWNLNDVMLFLMSTVVLFKEVNAFIQNKAEYGLPVIEDTESRVLLRTLKKGKKNKGGSGYGDFNPDDYYAQDPWLLWLRAFYCMLIINVSVKILNVAQFNDSIAFLVKILEQVIFSILPFVVLWLSIIAMFCFIVNALDVVFFNADSPFIAGDYEGFFGMFGAVLLYTVRMSVGDFQTDTIKFLPMPQRITMWVYFLMILVINVLIFMNFVIALINECYGEVSECRDEEAFQKKCAILGELNEVFGSIAQQKQVNILVTRISENKIDPEESSVTDAYKILKKQLITDRIDLRETIQLAQKECYAQKEQILQQIESTNKALLEVFPKLQTLLPLGQSTQSQSLSDSSDKST